MELEGLEPGTDIIGIFSINNYAYDVAILGGYYRNLTNCSLYDTLGEQAVQYICQQELSYTGLHGRIGQSISILGKVAIENLPEKRHITWALA